MICGSMKKDNFRHLIQTCQKSSITTILNEYMYFLFILDPEVQAKIISSMITFFKSYIPDIGNLKRQTLKLVNH